MVVIVGVKRVLHRRLERADQLRAVGQRADRQRLETLPQGSNDSDVALAMKLKWREGISCPTQLMTFNITLSIKMYAFTLLRKTSAVKYCIIIKYFPIHH